jgi:hypothetical protein
MIAPASNVAAAAVVATALVKYSTALSIETSGSREGFFGQGTPKLEAGPSGSGEVDQPSGLGPA